MPNAYVLAHIDERWGARSVAAYPGEAQAEEHRALLVEGVEALRRNAPEGRGALWDAWVGLAFDLDPGAASTYWGWWHRWDPGCYEVQPAPWAHHVDEFREGPRPAPPPCPPEEPPARVEGTMLFLDELTRTTPEIQAALLGTVMNMDVRALGVDELPTVSPAVRAVYARPWAVDANRQPHLSSFRAYPLPPGLTAQEYYDRLRDRPTARLCISQDRPTEGD